MTLASRGRWVSDEVNQREPGSADAGSQLLIRAQEYAEFRFAGSVTCEHLTDGDDQLGLMLTNANPGSCAIEIYGPGSTASIFAGPIRVETQVEGVAPVLWCLDLIMTYPMYEFRSFFGRRALVQEAPLTSRQRRRVIRHWSAWSGEVRSREDAAQAFGHPEAFDAPHLRTFQASLF